MKKLITLALAACFVLGSLSTASAIDVKVAGWWTFSYGYYGNHALYDNDKGNGGDIDNFQARMRARTQIEFIASETLSSLLYFEIGHFGFGFGPAVLDADQTNAIKLRRAYLDWTLPSTNVSVRMGIQGLNLPTAVTADNAVFSADVAGVVVNTQFTPEVGLSAFWIRPYNTNDVFDPVDNMTSTGKKNQWDEMDLFGFTVPIKTSAVRVTPWGMIGSVGKDTVYNSISGNVGGNDLGVEHNNGRFVPRDSRKNQSLAWWLGLSFEVPALDPFILKGDAMYGSQDQKDDWSTSGWYAALQAGYKWNWGTTSLIGWYASGDDGEWGDHDYGTLPIVGNDGGFSIGSHAFGGNTALIRDNRIAVTVPGTWGLGLAIDNVSFAKDLTHSLRAFYIRGTHSGERLPNGYDGAFYFGQAGAGHKGYLISTDTAYDVTLVNSYKVNDNFKINLDFGVTEMDLSKQRGSDGRDTATAYDAVLSFHYTF